MDTMKIFALSVTLVFLLLSELDTPMQDVLQKINTSQEHVAAMAKTDIIAVQDKVSQNDYYIVEQVVDGDTLKIRKDDKLATVRLIGVDTPETVHPKKPVECFGKEASDFTKNTLVGKGVQFKSDPTQGEQDKYGRLLGYVFLEDGTLFNLLLIQKGYAYEYTYRGSEYQYQQGFKEAQETAEAAGEGLWGENVCKQASI